jgi:hypothetical protein
MPHRKIRAGAALLLAGLTCGCAGDVAEQLYIQPGRYDYEDCAKIASETENVKRREEDLKTLIGRAEKDAVGNLISAASYRGDLLQAQGNLKMLAEAAQRKNCPPEPPAAAKEPAAPKPGAKKPSAKKPKSS